MEVTRFGKRRKGSLGDKGQMVQVTEQEALRIIVSLAEQLRTGSPNSRRAEFFDQQREYFSIAVHPTEKGVRSALVPGASVGLTGRTEREAMKVACEREDGLLNIHDEAETCEVCLHVDVGMIGEPGYDDKFRKLCIEDEQHVFDMLSDPKVEAFLDELFGPGTGEGVKQVSQDHLTRMKK